jgi:hypothetical protein
MLYLTHLTQSESVQAEIKYSNRSLSCLTINLILLGIIAKYIEAFEGTQLS